MENFALMVTVWAVAAPLALFLVVCALHVFGRRDLLEPRTERNVNLYTKKKKGTVHRSIHTRNSDDDVACDKAARENAYLAAMERAKKAGSLSRKTKKIKKAQQNRKMEKGKSSSFEESKDTTKRAGPMENFCKTVSKLSPVDPNNSSTNHGVLVEEGVTRYYHIHHLFQADHVACMLKQIAREFAPIIQRRGYQVFSVSEMCCCGDGLDTGELAGHRKRVQAGQKIGGVEQHHCGGYNRTRFGKGRQENRHTIHLRMRHSYNHDIVFDYHKIVDVMCHELAHCVHHNHGKAFCDLMAEIKREHVHVIMGTHQLQYGPTSEFDIHASSTAMCR